MIKVLVNDYVLDLSNIGITLLEKNNMFRDEISKNFSFPFPLVLTPEIALIFGIVNVNNITSYKTKVAVTVIENNDYYDGYLKVSKIVGKKATLTLYYGHEVLPVYDMLLNTLPFEKVEVADVKLFAKDQAAKQWPDATHNFVTIRDNEFEKKTDYSYFEGFLNNTNASGVLTPNEYVLEEAVSVAANKNVLVPMPYLMEIIKVGYAFENKVIKGTFVDDLFNHKIIHIPEQYLEQFSTTELNVSNFDTPTLNYISVSTVFSEFKKEYTAYSTGTYKFYFNFNLPSAKASYFKLTIKHGASDVLYELISANKDVNISETITLNIDDTNNDKSLIVELTLHEQTTSISDNNFLKYEYQETKLNIFENSYSLADFMPNITFREFINFVENFFNVDVDVQDNVVYLNYIDGLLPNIIYDDKSKYEVEEPIRNLDLEKVFALKYDDDSVLYVNKDGIAPSKNAETIDDVVSINIPVIALKNETIEDKNTAINTSESTTMKLCLYNGLIGNLPLAVEKINGRSLQINDVYLLWKTWLKFRTNSEIIEDTFFAHVTERFNLKKGMAKYNKLHLIKDVKKQSVNKKWNKITVVSETF